MLVPSHTPSRDILLVAVGGSVAILCVAVSRGHSLVARGVPNIFLVLFIFYSSLVSFLESDGPYASFILLTCVSYLLVAVLASQRHMYRTPVPFLLVPVIVIVQLVLSGTEEFLGVKALWPLTNGSDVIAHRLNPIAPWLAGRALGSTSHPIPLGILMAICVVLCLWAAIKKGRTSYWIIAVAAAVVLLFSGTRSAILALIVAIVFWFSTTGGPRRLPSYVLATMAFLIVISSVDPETIPGMSGFSASESYTHRANVLEFFPQLWQRDLFELFFGSGFTSISSLLQSSVFAGGSGIQVFDQEYIRTLTATGIIGFSLLVLALLEGLRRGNVPSRLVLICLAVTFFSFDTLSWNLLMTLFVIAASGPLFEVKKIESENVYPAIRDSLNGGRMGRLFSSQQVRLNAELTLNDSK